MIVSSVLSLPFTLTSFISLLPLFPADTFLHSLREPRAGLLSERETRVWASEGKVEGGAMLTGPV